MKNLLAFAALLVAVSCALPVNPPQGQAAPARTLAAGDARIVGYFPDWQGDVNAVQYGKLTHLCYAFLQAKADGSLDFSGLTVSRMQQVVTLAHAQGTKVLVSLGGWSNNAALTAAMKSTTARQALVTNTLNFVKQYNLDGLDFDWEGPQNASEGAAYTWFVQTVYNSLHPQGKLTTSALASWYGDNIETAAFAFLDFVNLMAYDNEGQQHSDYNFAVSYLDTWAAKGLPLSKMVLGVPFYGYADLNHSSEVAYKDVVARDPSAAQKDSSGGVYYNGIPTIQKKTNLVVSRGASGIMIWEISEDATGSNSLLSAIFAILFSGTPPVTYDLTASAGANGTIAPSGKVTVNKGTNQTYTFTPAAGYAVDKVTVDGSVVTITGNSYTFAGITAAHSIAVTFKPSLITPHTIVVTPPEHGTISPSGPVLVTPGANQTFTFLPDPGYRVGEVIVDGVGMGGLGSETFTKVTGDHTLTVKFVPDVTPSFALTATAPTNGIITPPGVTSVKQGDSLTYAIAPDTNYQIANVTVDGKSVGKVTSYTFANVTAAHTIAATFEPTVIVIDPPYDSGRVYNAGDIVIHNGRRWQAGWWTKGQAPGTTGQWGVWTDLGPIGPVVTYTLNASAGIGGTIFPSGIATVIEGANQSFTITPAAGYVVADVTVGGVSVGAVTSYTLANVRANTAIVASFKSDATPTFAITATAPVNGTITPAGVTNVKKGTTQTYSIVARAGFEVSAVTVDGTNVGAVSSYTFANVTANHTIAATFQVSTIPDWKIGTSYKVGDKVRFNGKVFVCKYAHVSNGAWAPDTPGLWFWELVP